MQRKIQRRRQNPANPSKLRTHILHFLPIKVLQEKQNPLPFLQKARKKLGVSGTIAAEHQHVQRSSPE